MVTVVTSVMRSSVPSMLPISRFGLLIYFLIEQYEARETEVESKEERTQTGGSRVALFAVLIGVAMYVACTRRLTSLVSLMARTRAFLRLSCGALMGNCGGTLANGEVVLWHGFKMSNGWRSSRQRRMERALSASLRKKTVRNGCIVVTAPLLTRALGWTVALAVSGQNGPFSPC